MEEEECEYQYSLLRDAKKSIGIKINLFSKITDFGFPIKSRGTDYVVILNLVDQSCRDSTVKANFLAGDPRFLPQVKSVGDIICLHNVEMKIDGGKIYVLYNKKLSSFALYYGGNDMDLLPYQKSAKYQASNHASELILQLRRLSLACQSYDAVEEPLLLRSIGVDKTFDIICKVIYIQEISEEEKLLYVWDGTDSPALTLDTDLDKEKEIPLPLHLEELPLSMEILRKFPHEGTILRIKTKHVVEHIDCWVKLSNITCEVQSGMWKGVMNHYSKVILLSDEDDNVKDRQRIYDERKASDLELMPMCSFPGPSHITEIDYENLGYSTLMNSLNCPQVVHKFKCIVRVIASCPWHGEDLNSSKDGHYRIRLTLEDPTARIHAYIFDNDGVKFFGGNPGRDELSRKMNMLLGIKSSKDEKDGYACRDPPWICCCIWSIYSDEREPWRSRKYRIFGTRLTG